METDEQAGRKVILRGQEQNGFAEIVGGNDHQCEIRFFTSPLSYRAYHVSPQELRHESLPAQTRCFLTENGTCRFGRVLSEGPAAERERTYVIQFPDGQALETLRESQFHVRSYLPANDPVQTLAGLAHETPYFFENRVALLRALVRQNELSHGLPAILSSKIDLLPHQAEIAGLVLRDPIVRYLLADEVGLGKTIEAGIILRQLFLDEPQIKMVAFVPDQLVQQWQDELESRFGLATVEILGHSELPAKAKQAGQWHVVVIDEAHRIVAREAQLVGPLGTAASLIAKNTPNLLLLSATPVLHHDSELLSLLELLDPGNYSMVDLAVFRSRAERRTLVGRAYVALRNATAGPLIKMNAKKLAQLLPDDAIVQRLASEFFNPAINLSRVHQDLKSHISETYRIHRRLLRTRRRWLCELDKHYVRDIEERAWTEPDEEPYVALWTKLDEWRIEVTARLSAASQDQVQSYADHYISLAEAISGRPHELVALVETVATVTNATESERNLLRQLGENAKPEQMMQNRAELVGQILMGRLNRRGSIGKCVVFCSSSIASKAVAGQLKKHLPPSWVRIADHGFDLKSAGLIFSEFANDAARILVTDSVGEEGFNLQFARLAVLTDLPWSPMRIEQRLGRLDRLDSSGRILCFDITTGEDENLCLDEVWRRVLAEGFGIFKSAVSDLQHIIDTEVPFLKRRAFVGGPEALLSEIEPLRLRIAKEREAIEEQDVIDGMHSISPDSILCRNLAQADAQSQQFGQALINYIKKNIGLHLRVDDGSNAIAFVLPRNVSPLIPADRLYSLAAMLNRPVTFERNVAVEDFNLEFLRPGHPAVDACRDLLNWDDRGRVFAMWRQGPTSHLKCVFRLLVHVRLDITPVSERICDFKEASIHGGGLIRLVTGWFPEYVAELFLTEQGAPAPEKIIEICLRPYDNSVDVNLGKERAQYIRDACGTEVWRAWCSTTAEAAVKAVVEGRQLEQKRALASASAVEHFSLARTRLASRQRVGIDSMAQTARALKLEEELESLVKQILDNPVVSLDTIGAYFISARPFWETKQ